MVTVKGQGFLKIKGLIVGKVTLSDFKIVNDTNIQFDVVTAGLSPGVYDVSVINLENAVSVKSKALTVVRGQETETFHLDSTGQNQ